MRVRSIWNQTLHELFHTTAQNESKTEEESKNRYDQNFPGPLCIILGGLSRERGGGAPGDPAGILCLAGRGVADLALPDTDPAPAGDSGLPSPAPNDEASLDREATEIDDAVDIVEVVYSIGAADTDGGAKPGLGGACDRREGSKVILSSFAAAAAAGSLTSSSSSKN